MENTKEFAPLLELGMQELEAMEAPGFWTGFSVGVAISGVASASAAVSVAVSIAT
ncbi:daptide-type RiPP [Streptomyces sp. QL37]|uniref:daptide-type RiPP n=1 Tax=Streptomyces sp. QL37 TaxID=2093747 RepID=UPI0016522247|nr:daptide-type RiPP [Streptomyces sp. QL37]